MNYSLLDLLHDNAKALAENTNDDAHVEFTLDVEDKVRAHVYRKAADYLSTEAEEFAALHQMQFENDPQYVQGFYNGLLAAGNYLRMQVGDIT